MLNAYVLYIYACWYDWNHLSMTSQTFWHTLKWYMLAWTIHFATYLWKAQTTSATFCIPSEFICVLYLFQMPNHFGFQICISKFIIMGLAQKDFNQQCQKIFFLLLCCAVLTCLYKSEVFMRTIFFNLEIFIINVEKWRQQLIGKNKRHQPLWWSTRPVTYYQALTALSFAKPTVSITTPTHITQE